MDLPFDTTRRRRIHLMRHAEADYFDAAGNRASDPRLVPLTARGRDEAAAMDALMADLPLDRVICSGLPRTIETASPHAARRFIPLEIVPALEEIRGGTPQSRQSLSPADYAYGFFRAHEPDARFAGGERYADFLARVAPAFDAILADLAWSNILIVAHGGVNRAILAHLFGLGLQHLAMFEQDSACLNVIDIDSDRDTGEIRRRVIRALNMTAHDPVKESLRWLTMEGMVRRAMAASSES
ncbi:MAG: histidine phosphatase family protein [Alphaproteobacteria bacterium]|nr:histidine phosphatase family protein [Alphaproteobacteria bacterium]